MNAQAMVSVECKQHVRLYRQYDIVSNLGESHSLFVIIM